MSGIESWALEYALRLHQPLRPAPIHELHQGHALVPAGEGVFHRVYHLESSPWVLKEGRFDIVLPLWRSIAMPIPGRLTDPHSSSIFSLHHYTPSEEMIERQFNEYVHFARFAGYFSDGDPMFEHVGSGTFVAQRSIRNTLEATLVAIEDRFNFTIPDTIRSLVLDPSIRHHNFLPREYLLFGESISPENRGSPTSFILQEHIAGSGVKDAGTLDETVRAQVLLFCVLMLQLQLEVGLVPDTRPRFLFSDVGDWLLSTDNLLVSPAGLKFVDTRLFWPTQSGFFRRGGLIPELFSYRAKALLSQRKKQ